MAKKKVSESTATIRDECDNIDSDVEDKRGNLNGDPCATVWTE